MDPIRDIINFQQDLLGKVIPQQYLQPFENLVDSIKNMDPASVLEKFQTAVEKVVAFSPLPKFEKLLNELRSNSGNYLKAIEENLLNPMNLFSGFMSRSSNIGKTSQSKSN